MKNEYYPNKGIFHLLKSKYKEGGLSHVMAESFDYLFDIFTFPSLKAKKTFIYKGVPLNYFYHRYNKTWKNERSIEIPVALYELEKYKGKRILEVGNVLQHYVKVDHEVLDKYEPGDNIIHEDILNCNHSNYDFIISISTIEHIGIDDKPINPARSIVALKKIQSMLKDGGKIFISFPVGYNSALTALSESERYKDRMIYKYSPTKIVAFLELNKEDNFA